MQGRTYAPGAARDELADAIRAFNDFVRADSRVDVVALPFRDGVSIITRRSGASPCLHSSPCSIVTLKPVFLAPSCFSIVLA